MSNYASGHAAEQDAAEYLQTNGFDIIELNWKTTRCEIDIVAKKKKRIYFVEVKSRKDNKQGYGYDYITPKKLKQMHYSAEVWVSMNNWTGEYQLSVISIDAEEVMFIEQIDY